MKTCIRVIVFLFVLFPFTSPAEDTGSVCLGPFLSVVWHEPSNRPYLTIGNYGPFHFEQGGQPPGWVIKDLDLKKGYRVNVHFKGKIVNSWHLNFENIGSGKVCIWRDKGVWRMEPVKNSKCRCDNGDL